MAYEGGGDHEFLIYLLTYSNKLACLPLITVLVYRNSPSKSHEQVTQTFSKNLEKYVWMNSYLESATLLNLKRLTLLKKLLLGIFQGFCLKVSEDLFCRKPVYL